MTTEPFFVVTSTAKNCAWARHCIYSVTSQDYRHYIQRYIAADRVTENIAHDAERTSELAFGHVLITHSEKTVVENVFQFWQSLTPSVIVVWLDGDDWLKHPRVLSTLAALYREKDPWLTYGSFACSREPPFSMQHFGTRYGAVPPREDAWRASHLKTFRAGLVQQVREEDLKRPDGSWVEYCTDQVFMLPMLEMAGERYEVVTEPLSIYNIGSSFVHTNKDQKKTNDEHAELMRIRALPRYERLEWRPW